ncbi:MAG: hypothetical protein LBK06_00245 [Planctomycetaceae bacterium]|jgi:hypothetical protein|nr:hypothetical protein [Planctomycetaceae bacterium]
MISPVEQLKKEYDAIGAYLSKNKEASLYSDLNKHFQKVLIISAGSYFEHRITEILSDFVHAKSNGDDRIERFLVNQAIKQKYHTLFTWGEKDNPNKSGKNANTFFRLFGDEFKENIEKEVKADRKLDDQIKAFIEIGHLRNILVHSNFADFVYDQKTPDEIFALFERAKPFLDYLTEKLN